MLKKNQRISKNQVSWLQKKGYRFSNEFFSVKFLLNKETFCRYSVVVSKKTLNLAVDRNLLRRQLYEIIRGNPEPNQHLDYLITVKPALTALTFTDKKLQLLNTLRQISSKYN